MLYDTTFAYSTDMNCSAGEFDARSVVAHLLEEFHAVYAD